MAEGFKNTKILLNLSFASAVLFFADRLIKYFILNELPERGVYLISGKLPVFIRLFPNNNMAFGIPFPKILIIILSAVIITALIFILIKNFPNKDIYFIIGFSLIIWGALGNFIDRVFFGYVIDYVHISILPVFNLADIMIIAGVIFFIKYAEQKR